MRHLEPLEVLNLLDEFAGAPALTRSSALIALCCPNVDAGSQSPGARNARLMEIRRANLGRQMTCLMACSGCAQVLEIEIDTLDFAGVPALDCVSVEHGRHVLAFHLPTEKEINAAARSASPLTTLVSACAMDLPHEVQLADPELLNKVSAAFDAADPLGCIVIEAQCPTCGALTQPVLDPVDLVWRELSSLARRLEDDVHTLARAYGWPEREILALPDARRRRYVERVLS